MKIATNYSFPVRICSLPLYEKNAIKYRLFLEYNKQKFTEGVVEKNKMMTYLRTRQYPTIVHLVK